MVEIREATKKRIFENNSIKINIKMSNSVMPATIQAPIYGRIEKRAKKVM